MPRSAKLKGLNLRYPIAWRDFLLRNTMSTGKLRNMMFKVSHFWDEKRPTKKSEDLIPTMLLPASPQPAIGLPRPALKDFWNNRRQESVPFVLKVHPSSPSRLSVHGPLWRTSETIGVGSYAIRFKSPSQRPVTDVRPRPAPTARSDGLLKQSAWEAKPFVSKVHPSGPSRTSVHGPPPRPALTDFWNNRREKLCHSFQKSIPAARHGRPSTARPHGPLRRTSETIGVRNSCRLFQKSIPAARHGRPSTARPHGPLWKASETIGVRNSCRLFQKSIPAARHGQPSTVRSHGQLWQTFETFGVRNPPYQFFFESPSQRPVKAVRPRPALTARSDSHSESNLYWKLLFLQEYKTKNNLQPRLYIRTCRTSCHNDLIYDHTLWMCHPDLTFEFWTILLFGTWEYRSWMKYNWVKCKTYNPMQNLIKHYFFKAWIILIIKK